MGNELTSQTEFNAPALTGTGFGLTPEEIAEEMNGDAPQFQRVKMPSGGGLAFEVPGDDPESPEYQKELKGVVVYHHKANAYWEDNSMDNSPPVCMSLNGADGIGTPGVSCECCPYNQFGSGEGGKGKACKNMERLYVLTEGSIFPYVLSLSPTSLGAWRNYKTLCITKGKRVCDVVTSITLNKKANAIGQDYSVAVFKIAGQLTPDIAASALEFRRSIKAMTDAGMAASEILQNDFTEIQDAE